MLRKRLVWALTVQMLCIFILRTMPVDSAAMYADPDGRFSFTVPDGYRPIRLPANAPNTVQIGYISPSFNGASVVITVMFDMLSDSQSDNVGMPIPTVSGFAPTATTAKASMLGNHPALQWEQSGPPLGGRLRLRYLVATEGSTVVTMIFTSRDMDYDHFIQESLPIAATFRLQSPFLTDQSQVFTDPEGRFRVITPAGWDVQPGAESPIVVRLHSTTPLGDFTILADGQPDDVSLATFVETTAASFAQEYPNAVQTGRSDVMLGNQPAIRISYTVADGTAQRTIVQVITIHDSTGYVLTSTATTDRDTFGAVVDKLIASWLYL